jgi:hypothetical protein
MAKKQEQTEQKQTKQRPVKDYKVYPCEAAVWQDDNGYHVTFKKSYYDKESDTYIETDTFFPDDLPRLALVVEAAYKFCMFNRLKRNREPGQEG